MYTLTDIIKRRSAPGVMIFDIGGVLLHANDEVFAMIPSLRNVGECGAVCLSDIPEEIGSMCRKLLDRIDATADPPGDGAERVLLESEDGPPCSVRAFFMGSPAKERMPTHIMVLVERIVERHMVDLEKAMREYALSRKEVEVVRLLGRGCSNREIGEELFISEYTVKDHVKKIMQKTGAGSRSEIMALLA